MSRLVSFSFSDIEQEREGGLWVEQESADSVLPAIGGHRIEAKCHPAPKV